MAKVILRGQEILIDDEDVKITKDYCWSLTKRGYFISKIRIKEAHPVTFTLARMVFFTNRIKIPHGMMVVTKNNNKYDLRKENLKLAKSKQPKVKCAKPGRKLPKYVYNHRDKFIARTRDKYLGFFNTSEEASAKVKEYEAANEAGRG